MHPALKDGIEQVRLLKINDAFRNRQLSDAQLQAYSHGALAAFFDVAGRWQLDPADQAALLGLADPQLLEAWRAQPDGFLLSYEQIERISYLLGIDRNLAALMPATEATAWVKQPERIALFHDRPPLELMKADLNSLIKVHNYLYGPLF